MANTDTIKKPYTLPDLQIKKTKSQKDVLTGSAEKYKEYIAEGGDWDNPNKM